MEISIIKIKNVVSGLLNWVRQDLIVNALTPTKSWLYEEFAAIDLDDTNFYTSLKSMLEQGEDDRRRLEVRLMFDVQRANLPTIHIHYPSEDGRSGDNTLNTGYSGNIGEISIDRDQYSRSFIGQYELIITGGNSLEVIMLYECLDALLIAGADTLAYNFDIFQFSGKQLLANTEVIPFLTYYRAIGLSLQNKKKVSSIISRTRPTDIQIEGVLYTDSMQERVVSVIIVADQMLPIIGTAVNIVATPFNGGDNPKYEWYLDEILQVGASNVFSFIFDSETIQTVRCNLISSLPSLSPNPAYSNSLIITNSNVPLNLKLSFIDANHFPAQITDIFDVNQWNSYFYIIENGWGVPFTFVTVADNVVSLYGGYLNAVQFVDENIIDVEILWLEERGEISSTIDFIQLPNLIEVPDINHLTLLSTLALYSLPIIQFWPNISNLINLNSLTLIDLPFNSIPSGFISPSVSSLQIGQLNITTPPDLSFNSELSFLSISGTHITSLPDLSGLELLHTVGFANNLISVADLDNLLTTFINGNFTQLAQVYLADQTNLVPTPQVESDFRAAYPNVNLLTN